MSCYISLDPTSLVAQIRVVPLSHRVLGWVLGKCLFWVIKGEYEEGGMSVERGESGSSGGRVSPFEVRKNI